MNQAVEEKPIIKFDNAQSAIGWAEEVLLRSGVKSQIGTIMKSNRQGGSSGISLEDVKDLAHTISVIANNCPVHAAGRLFCEVYGAWDNARLLGASDFLAHELHRSDEGERKEIAKIRGMAGCVIENVRYKELGLERRVTRSMMAKNMYITRQSFSESGWSKLLSECYNNIYLHLEQAERHITERLDEVGVF